MPIRLNSATARAVCVALVTFVANVATTQLATRFDEMAIDRSLDTIGEVYLDGLVASIKDAVALEKPGEVDRRLKAEFTEQNGIAEKLILILDGKGAITNLAGKKSLATPVVMGTVPGKPILDRDTGVLITARQFGSARAIVVLDVAPVQSKFDRTAQFVLLLSLVIAAFAGAIAFFVARSGVPKTAAMRAMPSAA